jgi:hypothetical protein
VSVNRYIVGLSVVVVFLVLSLMVSNRSTQAQGQSQVVVVNEVAHAVSPPLGEIPPIPPQAVARRVIPLRYPYPLLGPSQQLPDSALQTTTGPLVGTTSGLNFLGVGVGFGSFSDCCAPPDTNGAAGSTQFVQWVNLSFAVFNKSNGSVAYGPAAGNTLWQPLGGPCAANNSGDPIAQYDKAAGRWVMMQPVFGSPYYICAAVSTTSDATGSWHLYAFAVPGNLFPDYPKLAVWPDAYYLSYNQFSGNSFVGAAACALDRANMLVGNTSSMLCFRQSTSVASLLPSDLDGDSGASGSTSAPPAGSPDYFMNFGTNSLNIWQFHVDWTTPSNSTFTGPVNIPVAAFSEACGGGACIPQSQTRQKLDSLGDRVMYRLAYRNFGTHESLVVNHSVNTASGNTGIRWYELRSPASSPTVYQSGTWAPDSNYRWMGSIATDKAGDIALGYSVSSTSMHPTIRYTGRVPTDALGTLESEATVINGTGSQLRNLNRWGDYSSLAVDPADDCTFWYTTEYLQSSGTFNWSTRIASFKFSGCT